ncbi:MAG TPA: mycothiol system anti-sigma-R factor [Cyclobacteriaceae bacterium]|jgi:mycothiol system anti-sigma-R factor|nr:mycothiol system anti-sigma-R factor [Cyclobacteriaceae bacterium]
MATSPNPFIQADGKRPTCMEMLQTILDGEASAEQKAYFKQHMDGCMPCYKEYNVDMAIKELLKANCCGGNCPEGLAEQIKAKINSTSA